MPHRREGIIAPTSPAVRVQITVFVPLRSDLQVQRIRAAEPMSNWGR